MNFLSAPDDLREKWGFCEELPEYPRALALWSSPTLVGRHDALAAALFKRVGKPPLSRASRDLQLSRMLSLLDLAIASTAMARKQELMPMIIRYWNDAYDSWHEITDRWESFAETLAEAVTTEGTARSTIIAEEAFANSFCRRLIDRGHELPQPQIESWIGKSPAESDL